MESIPAVPTLDLSPFDPATQWDICKAVNLHIRRASHIETIGAGNDESKFEEQQKKLAPHAWVTYSLIAINLII